MKPTLGLTVKEAQSMVLEDELVKKEKINENLKLALEYANKEIKKAAMSGSKSVEVSYPLRKEESSGNTQFLITNPKSKDTFYSKGDYHKSIYEAIKVEGFHVKELQTKDSMSGVEHMKLIIDWT